MPEKAPGAERCGTRSPGWVNGKHPTTAGEQKEVQICFQYFDTTCAESTTATFRNCGDYFLYNLKETPSCTQRYCGSHVF